jgi:hypothetical protein
MKKITRKGLIKKLDKKFGEIVRSRGYCLKCNKGAEQVTLHCAHIFSRRNVSVRWDFDNAVSLCYSCHYWWAHPNPILFTDFIKDYLGEMKYESLKIRANTIKKFTMEELQSLLKSMGG